MKVQTLEEDDVQGEELVMEARCLKRLTITEVPKEIKWSGQVTRNGRRSTITVV